MVSTPPSNGRVAQPPTRIILLGASNLARGIATAIATAEHLLGPRLEVLATPGHGRSYGLTTSLLGRRLPGIATCGLWHELARLPPADTAALLTDIGNDLMYDVPVAKVGDWVAACLDRLAASPARTVVALLPLSALQDLSQRRFAVLRRILFPRNRLTLSEAIARASQLNERVRHEAHHRGAQVIEPRRQWYGFDPIHPRFACWPTAWATFLSPLARGPTSPREVSGSLRHWVYLRTRPPHERTVWGIVRRRRQPSGRLPGGTTVAFY